MSENLPKIETGNDCYSIKNSRYIPYDKKNQSEIKIIFLETEGFKNFKKSIKKWLNIYAKFEGKKSPKSDIDNILIYNLGIDGIFGSVVMELEDKNDAKECRYLYKKVENNADFEFYKDKIKDSENLQFNYEIHVYVNSALEVWYYARKEFIKCEYENGFFNGSSYAIIIEAGFPQNPFLPYNNNGLSIKKILDGTMLAMSHAKNTKQELINEILKQLPEDEFIKLGKNESAEKDIKELIEKVKGFNVDKLFIKKTKLQTNPPDDKIYAFKYFAKTHNNNEKIKINVKFYKL